MQPQPGTLQRIVSSTESHVATPATARIRVNQKEDLTIAWTNTGAASSEETNRTLSSSTRETPNTYQAGRKRKSCLMKLAHKRRAYSSSQAQFRPTKTSTQANATLEISNSPESPSRSACRVTMSLTTSGPPSYIGPWTILLDNSSEYILLIETSLESLHMRVNWIIIRVLPVLT